VVGHGKSVTAHSHDDGEPSGSSGRPALAVLRGSGLGDVAVVVTRYFGGTKLGIGGLVRAYGDAVRAVLAVLPRAVKVATHAVILTMPYALYEQVHRLVAAHGGQLLEQDFAAEVTLLARFVVERLPAFQSALRELSGGKLEAETVETNEATIMPVSELGGTENLARYGEDK
jgi:putative IMPACT (imprinted ancient) family translation regulator